MKAWHAKALTNLAEHGRIVQDVYDDLGQPDDYLRDDHISRTRARVQAVVAALDLSVRLATTEQASAEKARKFHVFISYSDRDKDEAQAIYDALVAARF